MFISIPARSRDSYSWTSVQRRKSVLVRLQLATKAPHGCPSPRRGAEENGKKQAQNWWVGIRAV